MHKIIIFILCMAVTGISCLKNQNNNTCPYGPSSITVPASEQQMLDTYIDTSGIEATKDNSGFYYQIITPGTGSDSVTLCSQVQISYTAKLINDSTFDQQNNAVFVLGALIEGWRRGIPKLKRGGEIKLYIPPTLGYGSTDIRDASENIVIPKNSILKCDIRLTDYTIGN